MGVTKEKTGTMPDQKGQLNPPAGGKTPGDTKVSPEDTPTISQKVYDAAIHEAKSQTGRAIKALEAREEAVKASEEAATEARRQRDAKELEDAKDDPAELSLVQRKQTLKVKELKANEKEKDLIAREAANKVDVDAAKATRFETDVFEVATKHSVDADKLKTLAKKLGITDLELVEELAKGASTKKPFVPYSGDTIGGGEKSYEQRLKERYHTMFK